MSYLVVGSDGNIVGGLKGILTTEPTVIPEGQRLSREEYLYDIPPEILSFTMEHGTAMGFAKRNEKGTFIVSVIAFNLSDFRELRKAMFKKVGVKEEAFNFLYCLPQLTAPWKRIAYLLRWILKG